MDVGANIGLAALFWLTRRPDSKVYCYEPNPNNVEHLHQTLRNYVGRYEVVDAAIAPTAGTARFTFDDSGRYGRISDSDELGYELVVRTVTLPSELARIEQNEGRPVDLVKIDTEGSEAELVRCSEPPTPALDLGGRPRPGSPAAGAPSRRLTPSSIVVRRASEALVDVI